MTNWCNFDAYLVGSREDIEKFNKLMKADFSYDLSKEFLKKLGLYDEESYNSKDGSDDTYISLEDAREKAEDTKNEKAIEMLKDENLKREDFVNIPEGGHLYEIFDYEESDLVELKNGLFLGKFYGDCACSLADSVVSCDVDMLRGELPKHIYAGTNLIEFARTVPNLKIALVSTETDCDFSEFYTFINGVIIDDRCENYVEAYYESVEEAKKDGLDINGGDLDYPLFLEYPDWFTGDEKEICIDDDYVLAAIGC